MRSFIFDFVGRRIGTTVVVLCLLFCLSSVRAAELECYTFAGCGKGGGRANSGNPSNGSQLRLNPSAVPTEKGFGIEGILFRTNVDVSLVRGLGRVGAAISPANSEETFFGPPGLEIPEELLERKQKEEKYTSQKITLAGAFDLIKRKNSGIKSYGLKWGLMGKYNQKTKNVSPGGGLQGLLGPFNFGASVYNDETQFDLSPYGLSMEHVEKYQVQTSNIGLSLSSLLIDYSQLRLETLENHDISNVRLLTASLFWKKLLFTVSKRTEDSERPAYNFETKSLEEKRIKEEYFGGIQVYATKHFVFGALYNYYLFREYSATLTFFF